MRIAALALIALVALSASAQAHPGFEHMRGTVTQMTDKSVTVQMPDKMVMTVALATDTKFEKSGKAATAKDLKAGDRVVIDYVMKGKQMIAKVITFGPTPAPAKFAPKHPKGVA